jgi:hypothetical protein
VTKRKLILTGFYIKRIYEKTRTVSVSESREDKVRSVNRNYEEKKDHYIQKKILARKRKEKIKRDKKN